MIKSTSRKVLDEILEISETTLLSAGLAAGIGWYSFGVQSQEAKICTAYGAIGGLAGILMLKYVVHPMYNKIQARFAKENDRK